MFTGYSLQSITKGYLLKCKTRTVQKTLRDNIRGLLCHQDNHFDSLRCGSSEIPEELQSGG